MSNPDRRVNKSVTYLFRKLLYGSIFDFIQSRCFRSLVVQDVGLEPTSRSTDTLNQRVYQISPILHFNLKTKRIDISVALPVELSLHGGESRI